MLDRRPLGFVACLAAALRLLAGAGAGAEDGHSGSNVGASVGPFIASR